MLAPWTNLLDVESAKEATDSIAKSISKAKTLPANLQATLSGIFRSARDPAIPMAHLSTFLARGIYSPFIEILSAPDILETKLSIEISAKELQVLLDYSSKEGITLLTKLVEVSPQITKSVEELVATNEDLWSDARNLPLALALLSSPMSTTLGDSEEVLAKTALKDVQGGNWRVRNIGQQVLLLLPTRELVGRLLSSIDLSTFSSAFANLAGEMARSCPEVWSSSIRHLVQVALQKVARACSAEGDLDMDDIELMINLGKSKLLDASYFR
jgi:hypothetical protein